MASRSMPGVVPVLLEVIGVDPEVAAGQVEGPRAAVGFIGHHVVAVQGQQRVSGPTGAGRRFEARSLWLPAMVTQLPAMP